MTYFKLKAITTSRWHRGQKLLLQTQLSHNKNTILSFIDAGNVYKFTKEYTQLVKILPYFLIVSSNFNLTGR
ncbi:hypothetical protein [uncultured Clostridium sp.]|uniref:hypothetical protein n=1 Tax=uncultured Clostridium sp. TaxID=59620 RepID=UPI00261B2329|nr:hypothetical protein [uncultured Clostridium sp.]